MKDNENKLRQEILNEAHSRADRIVARGKKDAENTVKKAKSESAARTKKRLEETNLQIEEISEESRLAIQKMLADKWLKIREMCLDVTAQKWRQDTIMKRAGSPERMDHLKFLIEEAVESINDPQILLRLNKIDIPFVTLEWLKSFLPNVTFTIKESRKVAFGVIAESADGRMVYDNSIDAILKRKNKHLHQMAAMIPLPFDLGDEKDKK
jgi:vacuolar-type H+-ATPase subunit E/Vma4